MSKEKVIILGASGMLGSMVLDVFSREDLNLTATVRTKEHAVLGKTRFQYVDWRILLADSCNHVEMRSMLGDFKWIINAIGVTKPFIHEDNPEEIKRAICINSIFPHTLATASDEDASILQIATDCVYSGRKGDYVESGEHDAVDVYGKTKSLGESSCSKVNCLRSSIIGPELTGNNRFLLTWLTGQKQGASVNGFTNHLWNGVTTLHFAKLCLGIIKNGIKLPHLQHIVPGSIVSKAQLLEIIAKEYDRQDINITPIEAGTVYNRTLSTENMDLNRDLWKAAGYATPPSVEQMVSELSNFDYRM